ncbi:MAG TPA: hypothetical protein VK511_08415 [Gemmatimonadaceae bacterium]|nr:hypothetical protein [Gemmatimonadaceae bacterium]
MDNPVAPILLQLTEEQQALIHRLSGQHAQMLELTPDGGDFASGSGRSVQFRWRKSVASGIPRQRWEAAEPPRDQSSDESAQPE